MKPETLLYAVAVAFLAVACCVMLSLPDAL